MTVKELKEELECYDDDMNVVFEVCDDFEPDSITENKYGWREYARLKLEVYDTCPEWAKEILEGGQDERERDVR